MNRHERNQMVVDNLPLVGFLVNTVMKGATHLSRDDLSQAGSLALVQAVDSFEEERGIPFSVFARERIIGGMRDEMRGIDWAKRSTRKQIKDTLSVQESLTNQLGRTPNVEEIAGALGVDRQTASEGLQFAHRTVSVLDETYNDHLTADIVLPDAEVVVSERLAYLDAAVQSLPENMRFIVEEIYLNERSVGDVAEELGVTHSAVSQLRSEAIRLLREGLETHYSDDDSGFTADVVAAKPFTRRATYLTSLAEKITDGLNFRQPLAV